MVWHQSPIRPEWTLIDILSKNMKTNKIQFIGCLLASIFTITVAFGGNPDRQGEAGAYELLMNPWARSAGLHTLNTAGVNGIEAMRLNIAGLSRINSLEVGIANAQYLSGTDMSMNAIGIALKSGKNGTIGISLMALNFGQIDITTTNLPDGNGATFSPTFFHLGLGYSHTFDNKVSVGVLVRPVVESISDVSAFAVAFDAGVQYVTGPDDNFKFGISLRNIGTPMKFGGEGLSFQQENPESETSYQLTVSQRAAKFELPSLLNIGISYDINFNQALRLTTIASFTSNSFSRDHIGLGLEFGFRELFIIRGAYKYELGTEPLNSLNNVYTGLSAGVSLALPLNKELGSKVYLHYAYRTTNPFNGTHNIGLTYAM